MESTGACQESFAAVLFDLHVVAITGEVLIETDWETDIRHSLSDTDKI